MKKPLSSLALGLMFICLLLGSIALWNEMRDRVRTSDTVEVESGASVIVETPVEQAMVTSPLTISGKARGGWFFEAMFTVQIIDSNGTVLGFAPARASSDWMTSEYVPFTATMAFTKATTTRGFLLFKKENPSDLPEYDATIAVPITFSN